MNDDVIQSICETIKDYRAGEISPRTPADVKRWARQIDADLREPLLEELAHVLEETYYSKAQVCRFLSALVTNEQLAGDDPCKFWNDVRLLDIQQRGASQHDMLGIFTGCVADSCGTRVTVGSTGSEVFIYLDDVIFTGNHVRRDFEAWITTDAPASATVHVIVVAIHTGSWYAQKELEKAIEKSGKKIRVHWWRAAEFEDKRSNIDQSDVLRPRFIPDDAAVEAYAEALQYPVTVRTKNSRGKLKVFSTEEGRSALEQGLLIAGIRVREQCSGLAPSQRPLGYTSLECLGFGSTVVTYRNCPNNCPLAFWAGDPWFPLFPRKTNHQTFEWGF